MRSSRNVQRSCIYARNCHKDDVTAPDVAFYRPIHTILNILYAHLHSVQSALEVAHSSCKRPRTTAAPTIMPYSMMNIMFEFIVATQLSTPMTGL